MLHACRMHSNTAGHTPASSQPKHTTKAHTHARMCRLTRVHPRCTHACACFQAGRGTHEHTQWQRKRHTAAQAQAHSKAGTSIHSGTGKGTQRHRHTEHAYTHAQPRTHTHTHRYQPEPGALVNILTADVVKGSLLTTASAVVESFDRQLHPLEAQRPIERAQQQGLFL